MNRMKKGAAVGAILLATALSIGVGTPAFADNNPIIANGDFESPIVAQQYIAGDSFGAWSVNSGVTNVFTTAQVGSSASGGQSLGSGTNFSVSQSFPTTPGATYQVRYYTHSNNGGSSQEDVFIGGVDFNSTTSTPSWDLKFFQFTASSSSTLITLQSIDSGGWGAGYFDDVRVNLVSLPSGGGGTVPTPLVAPAIGAAAGGVALLAAATVFLIRRRRTEVADGSVA